MTSEPERTEEIPETSDNASLEPKEANTEEELEAVTQEEMKAAMDSPIFFGEEDDVYDHKDALTTIELLTESIRPPATGAEQLIAQELALAIISEPMEKIRHVAEAGMVLTDKELEQVKILEDKDKIRRVHAVAQSLATPYEYFDFDQFYNLREMVKLALPFIEDEAYSHLHPWATRLPFESYTTEGRLASNEIENLLARYKGLLKKMIRNIREGVQPSSQDLLRIDEFKARYLYWSFRDGLTHETYRGFQTAFIVYAIPIQARWFRSIMRKVSPSSFADAISAVSGSLGRETREKGRKR